MSLMSGILVLEGWIICLSLFSLLGLAIEDTNFVGTRELASMNSLDTKTDKPQRTICIKNGTFMLNGEPLQLISGTAHYFQIIPAEQWRDRLKKQKAAGLNAVSTYVEWNFHEPEERQYRFEGDYDVAQYIRIAAEEGLLVLLRPGPYIDAERDMGGLPYWLLSKYPHINLRTPDIDFIAETKIWFANLFEQLTPLLYENGGPIILVQVENEYGSYGHDMVYKVLMRDIIRRHVTNKAILYSTDGGGEGWLQPGLIPGVLPTIDFGTGSNPVDTFNGVLRRVLPQGPFMNSEYYAGWVTVWGNANMQRVGTPDYVMSLRDMVDNKMNVNMYVFCGGTNYEFSAGAETYSKYSSVVTSYDFDAPLNESGDPTPKYYAIRNILETYNPNLKSISLPKPSQKGAYGKLKLEPKINLLSEDGRTELGKKYSDVTGAVLPTFEKLRQRAGLLLYETTPSEAQGVLDIRQPRDRIYVYFCNELQGVIHRQNDKFNLSLNGDCQPRVLSLLAENEGRICYGPLRDFKGILGNVKFNSKILSGTWNITGYPLEHVNHSSLLSVPSTKSGPVLYEGTMVIKRALDTFLDPTGWGKGMVWVNGHNLGRYWPGRGPQVTLFVPGAWLRAAPAHNLVQLLELKRAPKHLTIDFIDHPIMH